MLKRFLPREEKFFSLFQKNVELLVKATIQFQILLMHPDQLATCVAKISALEDEADRVSHTIFSRLHQTFITPFDRNDIHRLTSHIDDVLDLINHCALRFPFYHIQAIPKALVELADIAVRCALLLKEAIFCLHTLDKSPQILTACDELNALEIQGNLILLTGEKELFDYVEDFKLFHKLNEVYSRTKGVINGCQDVANIIKGIVLEYS